MEQPEILKIIVEEKENHPNGDCYLSGRIELLIKEKKLFRGFNENRLIINFVSKYNRDEKLFTIQYTNLSTVQYTNADGYSGDNVDGQIQFFLNTKAKQIEQELNKQAPTIKDENECCCNPDLRLVSKCTQQDLILAYLKNNKDCIVDDYCFVSDPKFNKSKKIWNEDGTFQTYIIFHLFQCNDKFTNVINVDEYKECRCKEYVCLNCKSIITKEEEQMINEFKENLRNMLKANNDIDRAKAIVAGYYDK